MTETPRPRPALRSAEDSGPPRPAPARFTDLATELVLDRKSRHEGAGAGKRKGGKDELVTLKVELPKSLRKELRVRAEAAGYSPEELVFHLVRSWLQR